LHPTGKPHPDELSGDVAVRSDSALSSVDLGRSTPGSEPGLTADLTPAPPAEPEKKGGDPAPPATFGRYTVRKAVGAGGFGAVYLGHDTQLDRPVAIKVLRGGHGVPRAEAERFLQEARRLAQLSHAGIVAVHDVGIDDGQVYLVSDFLDGPDLGRWLEENRPTWPEATRIAATVADALAHVHARMIVHRDVKPANIILTPDRGPVLVDFGLGLDDAGETGSELGVVSGTPSYMAPEQVAGEGHRIDGRSDIYSLGVVLYEMLCGRVPFRAGNTRELLRQVRDDEPQPPRQLFRDIPPELERACLRAMAKRLQDRYTTAADFAEDLRRALQMKAESSASRQAPTSEPTGEFLAAPPSRPEIPTPSSSRRIARGAERRQVTVLICGCEAFASEAFMELDGEDQAAVLRDFQRTCEEAVRRFDGTIVQCNEQALLVCFGYPVAYEDGARRAARTALGLLRDLEGFSESLRRQHKLDLNPWIGLHTGAAVVEAKEDAVSLVGEARNMAVRLESVAGSGHVLCSATTHRLIRDHFECTGLGPRKLKGVAQPVELFRVQRDREGQSAIEATEPAGLTPLTGRDHEISLLKDRWEQALEGMGQVVLLIGEPGLGKSRLVHTLKDHVLGRMVEGEVDAPVIEWRCAPHFQNTGLYPAIDFYERALGLGREEPPQYRFNQLLHRLEQYDLARPEIVPLWASLLSLPMPDRFPALSLSPARHREETFRAMLDWLHTRAARRPVLFVVEDLHWIDASTLEFLGLFLAEGLHDSILTVLTFRPEFQTPWPAVAHQTSLALNRLTRRQVGELMRKKTASAAPEALIEQIYERTAGVPLFVEEFTKLALESGVLDQEGGDSTRVRALMTREIPATLQDLVMARLDRMEGNREVGQLAAVLGRESSYELLAAVAEMDEQTLQAELVKLTQAEILYQKGRPPRCTYVFKHALLQDALYNVLVKDKKQKFHRQIAEVLEAKFPQTTQTQPELLAHHFTEAGLTELAIGYWLKAGLRSRERSAESEAIGHLNRGLALLETLDESPDRNAKELQFLNPLGTALVATRGYSSDEVRPIFLRAREICGRIGQEQPQFAIMWGVWAGHIVRGELRLSMDLAVEAMEFAARFNDPGLTMEALFMPGLTSFYQADFAGVRDHCGRAVADYDDRERTGFWTTHIGQNSGVTHRCYLALALWHLGYPDQATKVDCAASELARTLGHPYTLEFALHHSAWLHLYCRRGVEAEATAEEQLRIATEQGFMFWRATAKIYRGGALLLQGRTESAIPSLVEGLDEYRATGAGVSLPYYISILGEAYTRAGQFEDARRTLGQALAVVESNDDRCQEAELYRLLGELSLAEGHPCSGAEEYFCRAIQIAQSQQSRAWELRATASLARLWQWTGRRYEGRAALAAAYSMYTEGFARNELAEAAALLRSLET
jgi:serine/threonine protein kinase/tetratricopeptide (TPR) repeat protein